MSSPSDSDSSGTVTPTIEDGSELARLRRDIKRLQEVIEGKKRKAPKIGSPGRVFHKCASLYLPIASLICEADLRKSNRTRIFADDAERRTADRTYTSYLLLIKHVKGLKEMILSSANSPDDVDAFEIELSRCANDARNEDNGRIRGMVHDWVSSQYGAEIKPTSRTNRVGRGIQHDVFGGLLASVTQDWNNEIVRASIRDGEECIGINYFSRCFYEHLNGDVNDLDAGFLKSGLLVKTFCAIFTSPTSAEGISLERQETADEAAATEPPSKKAKTSDEPASKPSTRSNVAKIIGLNNKVTSRTIAYSAVMLHFNLTSAGNWGDSFAGYSYPGLYDFIIDYFDEPADEEQEKHNAALMKWWNKRVFPNTSLSVTAEASTSNSNDSLKASREARRKRQEEEAAAKALAAAVAAEAAAAAAVAAAEAAKVAADIAAAAAI